MTFLVAPAPRTAARRALLTATHTVHLVGDLLLVRRCGSHDSVWSQHVDLDDIRPLHRAVSCDGMTWAWGSRFEQQAFSRPDTQVVLSRPWRRPVIALTAPLGSMWMAACSAEWTRAVAVSTDLAVRVSRRARAGTEQTRPVTPATGPLRSDRDFRRFWLARVTSLTGSAVTMVALPVLVYRMSGSPLLTAFASGLEGVPYLLFGLLAGALADRSDRKRVMVLLDAASALLIGSIPLAHVLGILTTTQVLLVAGLAPSMFVFWDAAHFGAVPALVGTERLAEANSAIWSAGSVIDIAVPTGVGALLAIIDPASMLVVDALSFSLSALLLRAVQGRFSDRTAVRSTSVRLDITEGLGFLWRQPLIRLLTSIGTLQCLTGGAFFGLLVVWADRDLAAPAGSAQLGVLFGCWGLGGLGGTVLMPRLVRRWGPAGVTLRGLPCAAVLGLAVTFATNWPVAAGLLLVWGAAYTLVIVNTITLRQQISPARLMSRINTTARMLSFGLGWPVGALLGGALAEGLGPAAALHATACGTVAAAALALSTPLRSARSTAAVG